jgi:serine protease Do
LFIKKSPLMKRTLQRITGLAILALLLQTASYAQQDSANDGDDNAPRHDNASRREDEIIIRHKGGKDAKVTIEIKDGEVLVNGKPMSDFEDSTLSVVKRRINRLKTYTYGGSSFDGPSSIQVFPGSGSGSGDGESWSFNNNEMLKSSSKMAQLGVVTEKNEDGKGVRVAEVTKQSAAEKVGLKVGDLVTKVDGTDIGDPGDLSEAIRDHKPGDKVTVTISRDGKEQKIPVVLGKARMTSVEPFNVYRDQMLRMPKMEILPRGSWGELMGNSLKFGIRAQDAEDGKGVKVLDVDDESTASKAGIKEGDVITRFDGKEINSVTALTDAAAAAKEKVSVKVTIVRDGKTQEMDVKVPRRLRTADL